MSTTTIPIYVDGCRKGNGSGGWAYIIKYKNNFIFSSGYSLNVTNNMTELYAPIKAIEYLCNHEITGDVELISDSKYFVDGFNSWMHKWKKKGWVRNHGDNGEVLNLNLWKQLYESGQLMSIKARWVRGHTGVAGNEFCDVAANYSVRHSVELLGMVSTGTILQQLVKRLEDFVCDEPIHDPMYLSNNKAAMKAPKIWIQSDLIQ